jgi:glucose/arabinose dehydrogenase
MRRSAATFAALIVAFAGAGWSGPVEAAGFNPTTIHPALRTLGTGFDVPILATHAGDGSNRIFVVEQRGRIRLLSGGPAGTPFLDIHTLVLCCGERGLLGLAFHPSFKTNKKFYVNYTRVGDGATVIDEYRVTTNPNVVSTSTRRQILVIAQPFENHNGGGLAFGPDGYLYIGMGDGGSGGDPQDRAQNLNSLLGKMLRIDVNGTSSGKAYRIPSTNPFVGRAGLDEIWALGLRNPWRWSFDRLTGDLWIADVGQADWEEVDRASRSFGGGRGINYGWDDMEGRHCFEPKSGCITAGRTLPLAEYSHALGCSVTGGYVYRGLREPLLYGGYFFGDFCSGRIWAFAANAPPEAAEVQILDTALNISSFGETEASELLVVDRNGGIYQLFETSRTVIVTPR